MMKRKSSFPLFRQWPLLLMITSTLASAAVVLDESYEYDILGRLTKVKNAQQQVVASYTYDAIGNRTSAPMR
ncbi:RHS repeat domain-containing protein [Chitinivorax sp. B]|uniref:RHS repeat domain-containing protein n=1 Tax=Chitinivorax sp. B TaxID=2502235 RepID=UPI00148543A7|nr:RHS repeat domain-containing protein [Chitinivorax sp. B]